MVAAAARALEEAELSVRDLSLRRPTLDDVFLELTGATAAVDGEGSPEPGPPAEARAEARR